MKVIYSESAIEQLHSILDFLVHSLEIPPYKAIQIRDQILDRADAILANIYMGQKEEHLAHLELSHRRVVVSHYKIIYTIKEDHILITDIFDSRQDPKKMKGCSYEFRYIVNALGASTLRIRNASRDCEVKIFSKVK